MMSRRGMSSGGGASSLGYLFGSDAAPLARPNNRAPPRLREPPQASGPTHDSTMQHSGCNPPRSRSEQSQGSTTPTSGYNTPSGNPHHAMPPLASNHRPSPMLHHQQSRAAGKPINDRGDMSEGRYNKYFRANGLTSGSFMITNRRVQAAPGGGSSLGYLFGGT